MKSNINELNNLTLNNFTFESESNIDQLKENFLGVINFDDYREKDFNRLEDVSHPYSPNFVPHWGGLDNTVRDFPVPNTSLQRGFIPRDTEVTFRRLFGNPTYTHLLSRLVEEDTISLIFKETNYHQVDNEIRLDDKVFKEIYKIKDGKIEFHKRVDGKYVPPKPASYEF